MYRSVYCLLVEVGVDGDRDGRDEGKMKMRKM